MKSSSLRKIGNIKLLVAALAQGSMGPRQVAVLLRVSHTAARNYLDELEQVGVAHADPERRTYLRLDPDPAVVQRILASLAESVTQQRVALRSSIARHCVDPGDRFLHVLADDIRFPLELHCLPARRDPLVVALFGAL
jgi:hypothetical protein